MRINWQKLLHLLSSHCCNLCVCVCVFMAKWVVTPQNSWHIIYRSGSYSRNDRTFGIMSELSDTPYTTMYKIANSLHISAQLFMGVGCFFFAGDAFLCSMFMDTKNFVKTHSRRNEGYAVSARAYFVEKFW